MKIKYLIKLEILKEMASNCLNRRVDDEFYDYYFEKDMNWLLKNKEKIINDFYSLDLTFELKNKLLNYTSKFNKNEILEILEEE